MLALLQVTLGCPVAQHARRKAPSLTQKDSVLPVLWIPGNGGHASWRQGLSLIGDLVFIDKMAPFNLKEQR